LITANETNVRQLYRVHGSHKWINSNEHTRVDNYSRFQPDSLIRHRTKKTLRTKRTSLSNEYTNAVNYSNEIDRSLRNFDVQLQVNEGQLEPVIRYGVFSSTSIVTQTNAFKINQYSQTNDTIEPEMDMEHQRSNGHRNGYSEQNQDYRQQSSYRSNNGLIGNNVNGNDNDDGNGANPNRNNNNSRR
jgi:hypothetical protein